MTRDYASHLLNVVEVGRCGSKVVSTVEGCSVTGRILQVASVEGGSGSMGARGSRVAVKGHLGSYRES